MSRAENVMLFRRANFHGDKGEPNYPHPIGGEKTDIGRISKAEKIRLSAMNDLNNAIVGNDCSDYDTIYRVAKDSAIIGFNSELPQNTAELFTVEWSQSCTKVVK